MIRHAADGVSSNPEFELVAAGVVADFDTGARDRLAALLQNGIDWEQVTQLALEHGVAPTLHANLLALEALPGTGPEALELLVSAAESQTRDTRRAVEAAAQLHRALASEGVRLVVLKGLSLCPLLPSPFCRQMQDLDLLVHHDQLNVALGLLRTLGYVPQAQSDFDPELWSAVTDDLLAANLDETGHIYPLLGAGRIACDLNTTRKHSALHLVLLDELLGDAGPLEIGDAVALVPCCEDALIVQADHTRQHTMEPWGHAAYQLTLKHVSELYRHISLRREAVSWCRFADKLARYTAAHLAAWEQVAREVRSFAELRGASGSWEAPPFLAPVLGVQFSLRAVEALYGPVLPASASAFVAEPAHWLEGVCHASGPAGWALYEWTGSIAERLTAGEPAERWRAGVLNERLRWPYWVYALFFAGGAPSRCAEPSSSGSDEHRAWPMSGGALAAWRGF